MKKIIFLLMVLVGLSAEYKEQELSREVEEALKSVIVGVSKDKLSEEVCESVLDVLQMGNQISCATVNALDEKGNPDIIFCFSVNPHANTISWSLYDSDSKAFIKKVEYKIIRNKIALIKHIASDMWKEIFSEDSPFNNEICYLTTCYEKNQYGFLDHKTKIIVANPFIKNSQRTILQIKSNILDLTSCFYPMEKMSKLLFSLEMNGKILLMEFLPNGSIKKVFSKDEMIISPSTENLYKEVFYIKSGYLYYRCYDSHKNTYVEQRLDRDNDYVSVIKIPNEKQLIVAKNRGVYVFDYRLNSENQYKIAGVSGKRISSKKAKCGSIAYNFAREEIIVSEKIGDYYQLVYYQRNGKKNILTKSPSSKHDPAVSFDGNVIVYVAHVGQNAERYLEMFNYYTSTTSRIFENSSLYRFPVWVRR
jgi:hypothetical protein